MLKFEKFYTRLSSLTSFQGTWGPESFASSQKKFGFRYKHVLFLREDSREKVSVWYNAADYQSVNDKIAKMLEADSRYFEKIKKEFNLHWKKLLPYLKEGKKIEDIKEWKNFYQQTANWWAPMLVIYMAPSLDSVPDRIKGECIKIRENYQHYVDNIDKVFLNYIKNNFPKLKDLASVVLFNEVIKEAAKGLSKKEIEKINERSNGYVVIDRNVYSIKNIEKALKKYAIILSDSNPKDNGAKNEKKITITGVIGSKGYAKGNVRLVLYREDIGALKKGELLVTEMTTPDFIPAMTKAAAFITDEGGLTCHAAIIAREMKKPCVIGTKIATKILKDGDMVEVDANKGIVNVLRKKEKHQTILTKSYKYV